MDFLSAGTAAFGKRWADKRANGAREGRPDDKLGAVPPCA
jgi:hypothetical protein